jgi:hypothetical protein
LLVDRDQANKADTEIEKALGEASRRAASHWPALLALLVIAAGYWLISESLAPIPREVVAGAVMVGVVSILLARLRGRHLLGRALGLGLIAAITLAEVISTLLLVSLLPRREAIPPPSLLRDAAILWCINIVIFALWYWAIDGGGPLMRHNHPYEGKDFLFPQQQQQNEKNSWSPSFVDYLFLAFNHSTAFSPTDTAVLSRRAKMLVMIQAALSLMSIAVLAAKAINSL